VNDEAI